MGKQTSAERSYIAFISYRHLPLDREAAVRIQKKIENYVVPKEYREKTSGKKLGICFRDEDELPASSSLSESITYALDHTQYLIVICTPDLPQSKWCMQEIRYFLQTHDRDHVLAVLVDGTPEQSFPEMLRFTHDEEGHPLAEVEPLAANIAGENHTINRKSFKKEITRLIAAILGCPFDALWQRERRAKTNRLLAASGVIFAAMAVFIGVVLNKNAQIQEQNGQIQEQMSRISEQNEQISGQLEQISEQKQEIEDKNMKLERQMSTVLVDTGRMQLEKYMRADALDSTMSALGSRDPAIYDHRAETLLTELLGVYDYKKQQCTLFFEQNTPVERLILTEDESILYTVDVYGTVRAIDPFSGAMYWEQILGTDGAPRLYPVENQNLVICKTENLLVALSESDGEVVWEYSCEGPTQMQVLSDDKALFVTLDFGPYGDDTALPTLVFLDTATGKPVYSIPIPAETASLFRQVLNPALYHYGGTFSADNTLFACALPSQTTDETPQRTLTFLLIDLTDGSIVRLGIFSDSADMVLAMRITGNETVYCAMTRGIRLYSVVLPFDPSLETVVRDYDYSMSSTSGFASYDYLTAERPYLPALYNDGLAVLFSRNEAYLMNLDDGARRQSLNLDSAIVYCEWVDPEEEIFQMVSESGWTIQYDVSHYDNKAIESINGLSMDLTSVSSAVLPGGGYLQNPETGTVLAVPKSTPNQLILVENHTNPDLKTMVQNPDGAFRMFMLSPSENRLFVFFKDGDDAMRAESYDTSTGEQTAQIPLPFLMLSNDIVDGSIVPIDDDHLLYDGTLYGMDGSVTELCKKSSPYDNISGTPLTDGSLLFTTMSGARLDDNYLSDVTALRYWVDDGTDDPANTLKNCIALQQDGEHKAVFSVGPGGWLAGYGISVTAETGSKPVCSDTEMLIVQNVRTGEKTVLDCPLSGSPVSHLVFANRSPLLACCFETGEILIYDLERGTHVESASFYAFGEISRAAFSDKDNYLVVYTSTDLLDCFDPKTGERLCSIEKPFELTNGAAPARLFAQEDPGNRRLIISARGDTLLSLSGWAAVLDTDAWISVAGIDRLCCWSTSGKNVFLRLDDSIAFCPAYTTEELISLAEEQYNDIPMGY